MEDQAGTSSKCSDLYPWSSGKKMYNLLERLNITKVGLLLKTCLLGTVGILQSP